MAVTVTLPAVLAKLANDQRTHSADGATLGDVVETLAQRYPALAPRLRDGAGKPYPFVVYYLNDEDVRLGDGFAATVADGDEVTLVPPIAGGWRRGDARPRDRGRMTTMTTHTVAPERALPPLEREELLRYSRHLLLDQVGVEGQRRLKAARVLLVGAGGLGSPTALYLAAAGVGTLGIVDFDVVDASNLQRQILHGTTDVGRAKTASARDRLGEINPNVNVVTFDTQLGPDNALEILRDFDLVIDGSDSFATRFLTSDASVLLGKPNVYGSIFRFEGQASVFNVDGGPCYRCLFREPPPAGLVPNCAEAGVLGVLPGLLGTIQAAEALKLVLGIGDPLVGRLLLVDALEMSFRTVTVRRDPSCPSCGYPAHGGATIRSLDDRARDYHAVACDVPADETSGIREITPAELKSRIDRGDDFELIDVREPHEWEIAHLEGARLVPLGMIPQALSELDRSRDVVLYCKGGVRSLRAAEALQLAGFTRLSSVAGGIVRWSQDVDPSVPRY